LILRTRRFWLNLDAFREDLRGCWRKRCWRLRFHVSIAFWQSPILSTIPPLCQRPIHVVVIIHDCRSFGGLGSCSYAIRKRVREI
jgi:hypothetical protein